MKRRMLLRSLLAGLAAVWAPRLFQGALLQAEEVGDLKDKLEVGLRPRLPGEFAFIARVVELVELDALPLAVVLQYFQWARKKKYRPMPYFERVIRDEAERRGVEI